MIDGRCIHVIGDCYFIAARWNDCDAGQRAEHFGLHGDPRTEQGNRLELFCVDSRIAPGKLTSAIGPMSLSPTMKMGGVTAGVPPPGRHPLTRRFHNASPSGFEDPGANRKAGVPDSQVGHRRASYLSWPGQKIP